MGRIMNRIIQAIFLTAVLFLTACRGDPAIRIAIEGSTSMQKMMQEMADAYMETHTHITVEYTGSGSSAGIRSVISGTSDIGAVSRVVREEELNQGLQAIHIAWDAIAVIVHPSNCVQNLTSQQVARIFKKEITNWSEVGGPDAGIVVVTRDPASGTRRPLTALDPDEVRRPGGRKDRRNAYCCGAESQRCRLCFLNYIRKGVKAICIDGIAPSLKMF